MFDCRLAHMPPCAGVPAAALHPMIADLSSEAGCAAFVNQVLERHGRIDHGVSCFGSFWQGGEARRAGWRDVLLRLGRRQDVQGRADRAEASSRLTSASLDTLHRGLCHQYCLPCHVSRQGTDQPLQEFAATVLQRSRPPH